MSASVGIRTVPLSTAPGAASVAASLMSATLGLARGWSDLDRLDHPGRAARSPGKGRVDHSGRSDLDRLDHPGRAGSTTPGGVISTGSITREGPGGPLREE